MRECLRCHKYRGHNKKFCSRYCLKEYLKDNWHKIFWKNRRSKISPFLQELEKKDKAIMSKEWRIAGD